MASAFGTATFPTTPYPTLGVRVFADDEVSGREVREVREMREAREVREVREVRAVREVRVRMRRNGQGERREEERR